MAGEAFASPAFPTIRFTSSFRRCASAQLSPVRRNVRLHKGPQCSLVPQSSTLKSGIWLAQTSRLAMAAFQLGSMVTPAVVEPLYTADAYVSITAPMLAILQAVGFTNVGLFFGVRATRENKRDCYFTNAITMAATAMVYLVFRVKPPQVNIPFTCTLLVVAAVNAASLLRNENFDGNASDLGRQRRILSPALVVHNSVQVVKLIVGVLTFMLGCCLFPALSPPVIGQVYLLQVSLNLIVSAVLAVRNRMSNKSDVVVLAGLSTCLSQSSPGLGLICAVGALASFIASYLAIREGSETLW